MNKNTFNAETHASGQNLSLMRLSILTSFFSITLCLLLTTLTTSYASNLPVGFAEVLVAQDLDPVAMALAPDGRLFITEKHGAVRIVENGQLLTDPFLSLDVDNYNERGMSGIAVDPEFAVNGYIYIYYTVKDENHNRVSRFTAEGNYAVPGSEMVVLDIDTLNGTIHNAGSLAFGVDGKLFISVGDGSNGIAPQSFNSLLGKVLRINADGTIPEDNPFYAETTDKYRAIYALGFRNSFSMAIQPGTNRIFAIDVGSSYYEEVNEILPGKNYGWIIVEGPIGGQTPPENYKDPVYSYGHALGCAVVGAAFYNPETAMFPPQYAGKFFFADYCRGYIKYLDPDNPSVAQTFATNINRPLNMLVAPDGTMYYLARAGIGGGSEEDNTASENGTLWRIFYTGNGAPFVSVNPQSILVSEGENARFFVAASGAPTLSYQWQRDGFDIPGAESTEYIFPSAMLNDSGSVFQCIVTNAQGADTTLAAELRVTSSRRPEPEIITPLADTVYRAGEVLMFSGQATDAEDGVLDADALKWKIDFHHDMHTHPALVPTGGIMAGSYFIPQTGETADNVWYRIHLSATDKSGLTQNVYRDIFPVKTQFHVTSEPSGLPVYIEGSFLETPVTVTSVVGVARYIEVLTSVPNGDSILLFKQWSDGKSEPFRAFPAADDTVTFTAIYESYPLGKGTGLKGYYYDGPMYDPTFYEPYQFSRLDPKIDFDWGGGTPSPNLLGNDFWLVRWEGFIEPLFDDTYHFHVISDDGARLWVDNQMIINAWIPQAPTEWTGTIDLHHGKQYPIRLEYFEEAGGALCRLSWSSAHIANSVIPQAQLYPEETTALYEPGVTPVHVYPNPVYDVLTIDSGYNKIESAVICNSLGQTTPAHAEELRAGKVGMDVQNLPFGIYWLKCRMKDGAMIVVGFVKQ